MDQSCSGFLADRPGKRLKSLSAVQNSVTPWPMQSAATRASWTMGPRTRPFRRPSRSRSQCAPVSPSRMATGDSSQALTWSIAASIEDGGSKTLGWLTTARNSWRQAMAIPSYRGPARASPPARARPCHSESERCAHTKMFVPVAINCRGLRRSPRGFGTNRYPGRRAEAPCLPHWHPSA